MSPLLWARQSNSNTPIYSPFDSPSVAAGAEAVDRSSLSALTFLIWDILITTDDEVKYIWPRSWSYTKCIYFFVRYMPAIIQIPLLLVGTELSAYFHFSPNDCYIWGIYQAVASGLVIMVVDIVLVLRVLALYHSSRIVQPILLCGYILEVIGMVIGFALALPIISYDHLCLTTKIPETLLIYGAASGSYQILLFCFTLYKFLLAVKAGWGDIPLVVLLVRDGTWAFFVLALIYLAQLISAYSLQNHAFSGVFYSWLLSALSACGYRILINLNKLAKRTTYSTRRDGSRLTTNTHILFTTVDVAANATCVEHNVGDLYEPFPLGSTQSSHGGWTIGTSQISTLSLGM